MNSKESQHKSGSVIGYKIVNKDWTDDYDYVMNRPKYLYYPKTELYDSKFKSGYNEGFRFCTNPIDCYVWNSYFYGTFGKYRYIEVSTYDDFYVVNHDSTDIITNRLFINREIFQDEWDNLTTQRIQTQKGTILNYYQGQLCDNKDEPSELWPNGTTIYRSIGKNKLSSITKIN